MADIRHVTVDQCKIWDKSGKADFVTTCKALVGKQALQVGGAESEELKSLIYDVLWCCVRGQLKPEQTTAAITDIIETGDAEAEIPSIVGDILSVIDHELLSVEETDTRERFVNLISSLQTVIPEFLLKERLDADTLENIGLVQSKTSFQQKYVKAKTRIYYKQQKFNLLREESEGYSKLITELNQAFNSSTSHSILLETIKSLIGCFNLDPNRVLDVILESFECRPEHSEVFVALLREYSNDKETLCQTVGFKFQFYQQTRDSVTPQSLYILAALLLQNKLISLEALYAHLNPSDNEILEISKQEMADARTYARKAYVVNLGGSSGSTGDSKSGTGVNGSTTAASADNEEKKDKEEINGVLAEDNQKFGLCEALINQGAWAEAKQILDMLPPYSAVSCKSVCDTICRIVAYIIEPLYQRHSGLPSLVLKRRKSIERPKSSSIRSAQTFTDLTRMAFPMIQQLGCHLITSPHLLVRINRIARAFLETGEGKQDDTCPVFTWLLTLYDEVILPTLSLMPANCCMAEEVWGFIKLLKYEYRFQILGLKGLTFYYRTNLYLLGRYRLYGQWKNETHLQHSKLLRGRADILERTKYIMKRLTKENVKPLGRQLGKLSHSFPGVVFEYIQKYDNFIGPVVDGLKFLSSMAYDVLAYCIIEALANPERERLKTDDTNISTWLQSLAYFTGLVVKKYAVDLAGVLHYVANQLKAGKSYDLYVLREIIQRMAGIEISEEVTTDQLTAMSGGELLKQEAGYFTQVRNTKKSSSRLMDTLLEQRLAIPLCLLMAQQRYGTMFIPVDPIEGDTRHLKLIGKLYDQCHDTVVQFISFLTLTLSVDEIVGQLPSVDELLTTYHIPADVAFSLCRPIYSARIASKFDDLRKLDKKDKAASSQTAKVQRYLEAVDEVMNPVRVLVNPTNALGRSWDEMSVLFFTTFWSLSMYDLHVPSASYDKQIQQHKALLAAVDDSKDMNQSKKKKEKERCTLLIDKLVEEEKRQQDHVKLVHARLKHERDNWFTGKMAKHSTITAIIQHCLFPRCCFTANDSLYCAKFLYTLHSLKTPNFSSLICYDRLFSDIAWSMTSCTENEVHRYGRFLSAVLDDVMRWHSDKSVYEKECANYPGFVTVFRSPATSSNIANQLDFENFRHVVHKWHYSLTKVSVQCLESGDYLQIRNTLIILTKILAHYPKVNKLGQALERRIEKVIEVEKEKRPDIYCLALAYCGQLKASRKTWVPDHEFHRKETETKPKVAASGGGASSAANHQQSTNSSRASGATIKQEPLDGQSNSTGSSKEKSSSKDKSSSSSKSRQKDGGLDNGNTAAEIKVEIKKEPKESRHDKGDKKDDSKSKSRSGSKNMESSETSQDRVEKRKADGGGATPGDGQERRSKESGEGGSVTPTDGRATSHRRDANKPTEDRDMKRRKVEVASGSKIILALNQLTLFWDLLTKIKILRKLNKFKNLQTSSLNVFDARFPIWIEKSSPHVHGEWEESKAAVGGARVDDRQLSDRKRAIHESDDSSASKKRRSSDGSPAVRGDSRQNGSESRERKRVTVRDVPDINRPNSKESEERTTRVVQLETTPLSTDRHHRLVENIEEAGSRHHRGRGEQDRGGATNHVFSAKKIVMDDKAENDKEHRSASEKRVKKPKHR